MEMRKPGRPASCWIQARAQHGSTTNGETQYTERERERQTLRDTVRERECVCECVCVYKCKVNRKCLKRVYPFCCLTERRPFQQLEINLRWLQLPQILHVLTPEAYARFYSPDL